LYENALYKFTFDIDIDIDISDCPKKTIALSDSGVRPTAPAHAPMWKGSGKEKEGSEGETGFVEKLIALETPLNLKKSHS